MVHITSTMQIGKHRNRFFPSVLACKPSRRPQTKEHAREQNSGWDDLNTPQDAKGGITLRWIRGTAIVEERAVLNEVLYQDAPGYSLLLQSDHATSNLFRRDFGLVDRNDSRSDTDTQTGDDSTNDKHGDAGGRGLQTTTP